MRLSSNEMEKELRLAIKRITSGRPKIVDKRTKLSVSSVAREVGKSHSLLFTRYPDIVKEINHLTDKDIRLKRDQKQEELKKVRARRSELNDELKEKREQIRKLVSQNALMQNRILELEAMLQSDKVTVIKTKK